MKLKDYFTEQENQVQLDYNFDEDLFSKMANFIINLDPDSLTDKELDSALDIIENLDLDKEEITKNVEEQEDRASRYANKSNSTEKSYARKWYRTNKNSIKKRKEKFRRSSEGRKRDKSKDRMAKSGRTPTNKDKRRYHV